MRFAIALLCAAAALPLRAQTPTPPELVSAREALGAKNFVRAHALFAAYAATHRDNAQAQMGMGDADLGLHRYEAAELEYRRAVSLEPQLWIAHKDLVLVEAKLDRWQEFDRERALLRSARERGAPGISAEESDLIDSFTINGAQWLVREYYVPVGRSHARYNFEHFTPAGKVAEYISLEAADAARQALAPSASVRIGKDAAAAATTEKDLALNWYTGSGHGTVKHYAQEPTYQRLRADVVRWLSRPHAPR